MEEENDAEHDTKRNVALCEFLQHKTSERASEPSSLSGNSWIFTLALPPPNRLLQHYIMSHGQDPLYLPVMTYHLLQARVSHMKVRHASYSHIPPREAG